MKTLHEQTLDDIRELAAQRDSLSAQLAAVKAELEAARARLDMDDEELVAEIAYGIGEALKHQPDMGGNCRNHEPMANRRSARAAIRSINRVLAIRARGKTGGDNE